MQHDTEKTEQYFREQGIELATVRLIEDNFRYQYIDIPVLTVNDLTEKGIYDPKSHECGELDAIFDVTGYLLDEKGTTELRNIMIWKTPCGHSRIWSSDIMKLFDENDLLAFCGKEDSLWFFNLTKSAAAPEALLGI